VLDLGIVCLGQSLLVAPVFIYWWPRTLSGAELLPSLALSAIPVVLALALGAVYYVYFWGVRGATPGKQLLGLAVEGADGRYPIGIPSAFMRLLGYVLSAALLGVGFVLIAFGVTALHDRIAATRVVRRERI
jgi:uncharacterized RDD family membrane protein YckC